MKVAQLIKILERVKDKNVDVMVDVDSYHCEVVRTDSFTTEEEYNTNRIVLQLGRTEGIDY